MCYYNCPETQIIIIMNIDKLGILASNLHGKNKPPSIFTFHVIFHVIQEARIFRNPKVIVQFQSQIPVQEYNSRKIAEIIEITD